LAQECKKQQRRFFELYIYKEFHAFFSERGSLLSLSLFDILGEKQLGKKSALTHSEALLL